MSQASGKRRHLLEIVQLTPGSADSFGTVSTTESVRAERWAHIKTKASDERDDAGRIVSHDVFEINMGWVDGLAYTDVLRLKDTPATRYQIVGINDVESRSRTHVVTAKAVA